LLKLLIRFRTIFAVDGVMSLTFGLATYIYQFEIFSTAYDLQSMGVSGRGDTLIEAALLGISGYYVLVGAILIIVSNVHTSIARPLGIVVALHHAFMAVNGALGADRPWLVGSPWWDVVIHTLFVLAYMTAIVTSMRTTNTQD